MLSGLSKDTFVPDWCPQILAYRKSSIKPPPPPCRGLFHLEKTMVSVLQKELEYKVEKLKIKKV